ncbi:TonB-dependent receptor [Kiloniella sp. b19]|uniref:TonB-dependent receptor n=1 Tax=Kiloniella sp. GXU_MW_B19 TaxID=3141326 RepID=UPI0031DE74A9
MLNTETARIRKMLMLGTTALVLNPGFSAYAQSAETPEELEAVVITASRSESPVSSIPGTVQIISGEEIVEASKATGDITQALGKMIPGFSLDNGTLAGGGETFRGRTVQVLVNGTPRNIGLRNISRILSLINPNTIERIEVIAGASGVYGDGGTGGILNIITKDAREEGWSAELSGTLSSSEQDLADGLSTQSSASVAYRKEVFSSRLDARIRTTGDMFDGDGDQIAEDPLIGQGGGSGIEQYDISTQTSYQGENHDITLFGSFVHLEQDIDHLSNFQTDPVSVNFDSSYPGEPPLEDTVNLSLSFDYYDLPVGDINITGYFNDAEKRASFVAADALANPFVYSDPDNPGLVQDPDAQSVLFATQLGLRTTVSSDLDFIHDGVQLNWGVDYSFNDVRQEILDGRDIIAPMKQNSYAAFAQLEVPVGDYLDLRAGIRHERFDIEIDDFTRPAANFLTGNPLLPVAPVAAAQVTGADTTYEATVFNAGAVVHVTEKTDIFAGFSQGYSVPDIGAFTRRAVDSSSLAALSRTSFDFSDIAPDAAVVNNYEIGTRFNSLDTDFSLSAFLSTSDKGTNITSDALALSQNKERIYGAELTLNHKVSSQWNVGTVLAYQEGQWDQDGDGRLDDDLPNSRINTPFKANVFSGYRFSDAFAVYGEAVYTAGRDADDGGTRQLKLDPTFTLNGRLNYDSEFGLFQFGIDNILDREQENPVATSLRNTPINAEGRRFYLSLTKEF